MFCFFIRLLLGGAIVLGAIHTSQADLILDLRYTDLSTSKTVNSGDHVFVDLLLTDNDASTPLVAEGLLSGGGRLMQTAGTILLSPFAMTGNSGWIDSFSTNPVSAGGANEIAKVLGATDFFFGPAVFPVGSSVVIATFELIATGAPASVATIAADLLGSGFSSNMTFDTFVDLELTPPTFGSIGLTINGTAAVPEPATMMLGGMSLCVAGAAAWRRRRAARRSLNATS